ncbi:MAG: PKD domain-containing protein, partial [Bacteroidetes bacterium]|nr:PKD domain-containing protein [Bacteroidota bacterium]
MNNGVTQTTSTNTTTYTYTSPGKYIPKLLLSDGNSCIVPIQGPDTIKVDKVTADFSFSPNNQCGSGLINFIDTILYQVNPIATRFWTFGDGGTATTHNPSHSYAAAGTYTVKLVVTSTQGCKDSVIKTVTILPKPIVSAGNNVSICQGNTIPVQLQATGAVSYVWTPSSGLSCTNCANPLANPTVTTTYKVTGTGANGCSDTSLVTITVNPLPTIQTGPNPTICAGGSIQLAVAGATTYSWTPSTGLSCNNCNNPTASPATTTTYTITGTSSVGCSNTAQITVNVSAIPNVTATATKNAICIGDSSKLQALGGGNYSWSPAIGLSCVNCANPTANPTTTTTYIVSGSNSAGCTDTGMVTIVVNPLPVLSVPNKSVCIGSSVLLQASGANTYAWTPSTGLSCNNCANPTATISNTTTYSITGTSAAGCVSNTQMTITVNPLPVITANPNQTACNGTPVQLTASGGQTYVWSPSTGLSCTNCTSPTATPASTTTYTVVGKDANGCVDTARTKVSINPLPNVNAGPDRSICKLNSTQLQATGAN